MLKRLLLAALVIAALCLPALAAGTVNTALSTTVYTDLGTAPVQVQALGGNVRVVVADSLPDPSTVGLFITPVLTPVILTAADASSHAYALALNPGATIATAPSFATSGSLPSGAATSANQTNGSQKTQVVDGSGNVIGSTSNALNAAITQPLPAGTNTLGLTYSYSSMTASSVTRAGNTTTYTANTGWCNATSACATVFSWSTACRVSGGDVLIPEIDIYSSANPTTKLSGVLWLFSSAPGTVINDNATFNIASADFANLTGGSTNGLPFTLASAQASGASNSGASLVGSTLAAHCTGGTTLYGMIQVVNAYVPANAEVLSIKLRTVGLN